MPDQSVIRISVNRNEIHLVMRGDLIKRCVFSQSMKETSMPHRHKTCQN